MRLKTRSQIPAHGIKLAVDSFPDPIQHSTRRLELRLGPFLKILDATVDRSADFRERSDTARHRFIRLPVGKPQLLAPDAQVLPDIFREGLIARASIEQRDQQSDVC